MIGIANNEGFIESVDDPITKYLLELADRDRRIGDITICDLLLMSSGLDYVEFPLLFNSDDILIANEL